MIKGIFRAPGGRLSGVDVVATQPASYLPHDRHISSSIGVGLTFSGSFGTFDQPTISQDEGIEFSYRSEPAAFEKLQKAERRFEDDRSAGRRAAFTRY